MGNEAHDFLPESDDSGQQPGPSWARADWRTAEDDLTRALDPDRRCRSRSRRPPPRLARRLMARRVEEAAGGFDPRDDADPHLPRARASGRRSRSAGAVQAGPARRSSTRIPRLFGAALDRKVYLGGTLGAAMGHGARTGRDPEAQLLRQGRPGIHAHLRRRGTPVPAGPDRGRRQVDRFHPRGQEGDPRRGDPRRAVREVPRHANMSAPSASGSTAAKR